MPENWKTYKLSDVVQYTNGGAWPASSYSDFGIPVVRVSDIKNGVIDLSACKFLDPKFKEKYSKHFLKQNDVIICTVGSHPDQQSSVVGRAGIVSKNEEGAYLNQNAVILRSGNSQILDQKWLIYFAKSRIVKNHIESEARGSANQVRIAISNLLNLKFNLPPLQEQKSIASILSALDDKIELNLQMNKTLKEMAMALYKHWFVDFGPFQDVEFVDSELGEIPKGWEVQRLDSLLEIKYGKDHKKLEEGRIPVYGTGGIMRYVDQSLYDQEAILIPRKGSLNNLYYLNEPFWTVDTLFYSKIKKSGFGKYVFHFLKTLDLASMDVGSAVPSLTTQLLNRIDIIIPPYKEVLKYEESANIWFSGIQSNIEENKTLTTLRDTLLPKLISGEVRVKDAEKTLTEVL